jgi:hypothetical protein
LEQCRTPDRPGLVVAFADPEDGSLRTAEGDALDSSALPAGTQLVVIGMRRDGPE